PTRKQVRYYAHSPELLPGGGAALLSIRRGLNTLDSARLAVVDLNTGYVTELGIPGLMPHYAGNGYIVFGRAGGEVYAAPFSLRRRAVTGPDLRVLGGAAMSNNGLVGVTVSQNGILAVNRSRHVLT